MRRRRSASFACVAGALLAACGARSGVECFGEACVRVEDEPSGFDPGDGDPAGGRPPVGDGGRGGRDGAGGGSGRGGSGGGAGRGGGSSAPEQLPTDTPLEPPAAACAPPARTLNRSIDVSDEATLQSLDGCEVIDGALTIFGRGLRDLRPLSRLRLVTRALRIASYGGSLDGLEALEAVDALTIESSDVATLAPLGGLRRIGGTGLRGRGTLRLRNNPNLVDLAGLGGLVEVLALDIQENAALTSLDGLSVPAQLESVSLVNHPQLADVTALQPLQLAEAIVIEAARSLQSLGGLSSLREVRTLSLVDLPALRDLALPVVSVNVLYLDGVGLGTLDGLSAITRIESAVIQNNPNLVEVDRLGSLEALDELSVLGNPSLVQLPSFVGVLALNQLYVRDNAALAAGPGFPLVTSAGTLLVSQNPALTHLTGLGALASARTIDISQNASLVELDLGALSRARSVRVTCNAALPEASLDGLRSSVDGSVDVWGNFGSPTPCP